MKIKTFQALSMQDAIRAIKEELGSDAVILSSKRIRKGGRLFGLFGRSMVEVAAAVELDRLDEVSSSKSAVQEARRAPARSRPEEGRAERDPGFSRVLRASMSRSGTEQGEARGFEPPPGKEPDTDPPRPARKVRAAAPAPEVDPSERGEPEVEQSPAPRATPARHNGGPRRPSGSSHQDGPGNAELYRIREELQSLRDLLNHSAGQERRAWLEGQAPGIAEWYDRLIRNGLEPNTAQRLLLEARNQSSLSDRPSNGDLRLALQQGLNRNILVSGPMLSHRQRHKAVLFVGPAGVGKTTTIAKLAAHYRLRERRSVSLITLDTYRVAAVEQLRTYANVIGVTMDVALTTQEALEWLRRRSRSDLILIDTAGRSPIDVEGTEEVRRMAGADHQLEVHLVLSVTTRDRDLMDSLARYAGLPLNRLLFTKLDETASFGTMFELMRRTGLPLSYFSKGQRVPDDLEIVTRERLTGLLLDGRGAFPIHHGEEPAVSPSYEDGDEEPAALSNNSTGQDLGEGDSGWIAR